MSLKSRISMAAKALFAPDFADVVQVELELRRQQLLDAELKQLEAEAEVKFIENQMDLLRKVRYTLERAEGGAPALTGDESNEAEVVTRLREMFPGMKVVHLPEPPSDAQKG